MQYKKKVPVHFFQCNLFGLSGCQFVTCLPIFLTPGCIFLMDCKRVASPQTELRNPQRAQIYFAF